MPQKKTPDYAARTERNLKGVHPDLVAVVRAALKASPIPFVVIEGLRTVERQRAYVASGASRTMNSRHLTGHAIDFAPIVDGEITWKWPPFKIIAEAFKAEARTLGISIVWGGDWARFRDGPHIELDRKVYP